jgi:DNA polymerase/3'-5' exonuclease PolX
MNQNICEILSKLVTIYDNNNNKFKSNAIKKAIYNINNYEGLIESGQNAKENIKGIGPGIMKRIDEIIKTGTLSELNDIDDNQELLNTLQTITGIGPKKAKELVSCGIKSLDDLINKINNNEISVTHHIKVGLKYFNDIQLRIPCSEIELMGIYLKNMLNKIDTNLILEICGSYRRGKKDCGDIDILITNTQIYNNIDKNKYLTSFIKILKNDNFIVDDLTKNSEKKYMGICKLHTILPGRRIDIRCVNYVEYYTALVYFTGSKENNIILRNNAIKKNLKLNEYGLFKNNTNERIEINNEESLYNILEVPYLNPTER